MKIYELYQCDLQVGHLSLHILQEELLFPQLHEEQLNHPLDEPNIFNKYIFTAKNLNK